MELFWLWIKRKHELSKIQQKNFINRFKYAEDNFFCICRDVYKICEDNDYDRLSTLKIKKLKIYSILIEKYKDMLGNPGFEQDYWSRKTTGIYKKAHDSIRLMKWLAYHDRSYHEKINYYDLMGSVLKCLNEISQR